MIKANPNSSVMIPLLGPMSRSETGARRLHTQPNKPHNIHFPRPICCRGTHASSRIPRRSRRDAAAAVLSQCAWVDKSRRDAVRRPFNRRGAENIRMRTNSVCTVASVLNPVCDLIWFLQLKQKIEHRLVRGRRRSCFLEP